MKKVLKWGLGIIIVLLALVVAFGGNSDTKQKQAEKVYNDANISVLIDQAKANAAKAKQDYNGKNLKITNGVVRNIDSNGNYFTIEDPNQNFELMVVSAHPANDKVKKEFVNLKKGSPVVVYGTVTDVGDIMGYTLKVDKFEQ